MKKYFMINYIHSGKNNTIIPLDNVVQMFTFDNDGDYCLHFVTNNGSIDILWDEIDSIDIIDLFQV